jgi:CheY-like chemotaxis protein
VKSAVEMLKLPNPKEGRHERYVNAIDEAVGRAAKLTQQLLAFARRQTLKPELFDTNANIQAMDEMMQTLVGARVEIVRDLPDEALCVSADTNQFDTALVNLAVNARDAMAGEGQLTIRVRSTDSLPALRERAAVAGSFVAITIADTGSGIAPVDREKIFEPFYTTKPVGSGTGLGLSQVFGFARQSGGDIQVESEVGKGSRFTLYLPQVAAPARVVEAPAVGEDAQEPASTPCVLVVEDNAMVAASTVDALGQLGFTTVLASNGMEGLQEIANDATRFDVVFSDVVMPGMTGIEMGREIRRLHGGLPVVLASGYSNVLAAGGTDGFELIQKPYSIDKVSRILRRAAATRVRSDVRAA